MATKTIRMTARDARRLAISSQRLVAAPSATRRGLMEIVREIGYLQLDPTSDLPIHAATMRSYRQATDPGTTRDLRGRGDNAGGGTRADHVRRWLTRNR